MRPKITRQPLRRAMAGALTALLLAAGLTVVTETAMPISASAAQNPTSCQSAVALTNGGFETPTVPNASYRLFPESQVPGWLTNDSLNQIELWSSGFQGVPAAAGRQFAELNANSASRLYQDVTTTPGQTLAWSLKHRGRAGVDVMRVLIGPATGALAQNGPNLSDGTTAWGTHTGTYTVPAGQTVTRFAFEAVSSAGGSNGVGNFLDDITFGTGPCLITTKTVANLTRVGTTAEVGDTLRYTVTTRNDGGNPALQPISSDVLATGLEFVPGSLRIVSGPGVGTLTGATGDDRGDFTAADRTVRVRLGDGGTATAGGSIAPGTATSYTFDAKVNVSAAAGTVLNEARVAFRDAVVNQNRTSISQETQTPVNPAADLAVIKTLDTAQLVAGLPATFTVTATNNGPQAATGVVVTDVVPPGLMNVTATSGGASCTVAATISCAVPDMGVGDSVDIEITGTVVPSRDPGAALTNTATVSGSRTDPDLANNSATVIGTLTTSADVSIEKSFAPSTPVAGQDVTYELIVHNDGPSEARDVVVTDPLDPETTLVSVDTDQGTCGPDPDVLTCAIGTLAPGATATVTVVVRIATGATAVVQNTASVTTSTTDSDPTDNVSSTSFQPDIIADLAVVKTASASQVSAGVAIDFTLAVSNLGASDAVNAVLSDTLPAGFTVTSVDAPAGVACDSGDGSSVQCTWATLSVGGPVLVVVHAVVAADAPAGIVTNTASVASPADDRNTANNSSSAQVEVVQSADLAIEKSAPATGEPGSEFAYTIVVTNNGPSTARGATATDVLPAELIDPEADLAGCTIDAGTLTCQLGDIEPGGTRTVQLTGTWRATATGTVVNTAAVASATPDPVEENDSDQAEVSLVPSADVSITKSTTTPTVPLGGDVSFVVTVRNDGPSAAVGVVVDELPEVGLTITGAAASAGTWSQAETLWTVGTLLPGDEQTLTVTGTADAVGVLVNSATAASQTPDPDEGDLTATATVQATPSADLSIVKTISVNPAPVDGDVTYTLVVENNGPGAAADFAISDVLPAELLDAATTTTDCAITDGRLDCAGAPLGVGETFTVSITGTIDPSTASESISNTATVTSTTDDPTPANNESTVTVPLAGTPAVELVKVAGTPVDATGDGRIGAGDTVSYTFTVRNTGPVTLTSAAITDPLLGGAVACAAFTGPLAPGTEVTCAPVQYVLTQADVDAGTVHNAASVVAQSARGPAEADAEADATVPAVNGISLDKAPGDIIDADDDGAIGAGDTIAYAFTVTNTGTTTLTDAQITDAMLGGAVPCAALDGVSLAPGDEVVCAPVAYELTQEDVDDGFVHNEASVVADSPFGEVFDTASADATFAGSAGLELVKTAGAPIDANGDGLIGAGDSLSYTFAARNTGTTTLSDLEISDPLLSDEPLCVLAADLAPGETYDCGDVVFDYTLTQDDVESEIVRNTATADASSPLGPVADDASADVVITGTAAVELTKTAGQPADADGDGRFGEGDTVSYTFTVRNTGTTILRDIVLDDPLLGGAIDCAALGNLELDPQDEVGCGPVEYAFTQVDIDAGTVHNTATVTGEATSSTAEDTAEADVEVTGTDALSLLKSAAAIVDANGSGRTDAGDTIAYTFTVENTGTTTLSGVSVSDPRLAGDVVCETVVLAPGEATLCSGPSAVLAQAEMDAGEIVNTATATGTGTGEEAPTAEATVVTPIETQPAVALVKTGGEYADVNGNGTVDAGDSVQFRFTVTNTGAVTLTGIMIDDPKLGGAVDCGFSPLAPGEKADCGPVGYVLTSADVAAGEVVNVATATALAGTATVTAAATVTIDLSGLATTGGMVTGVGWALALLAVGLVVMLVARVRRNAAEI